MEAVGRLRGVSDHTRGLLATKLKAQGELSAGAIARERVVPRLRLDFAHLVRIAEVASTHEGDDEVRASLRAGPLTRTIPLEAARAALVAATRHRELLLRYGMPEGMLERLRRDLDRYCAVLENRADASATIAAANTDLARLADEARGIIRHLDALNRIRFSEDPQRQAEWDRVSAVRWGKAKAGAPNREAAPDEAEFRSAAQLLTRLSAAEEGGILGRTGKSAPTVHWRAVRRRAFATGRWTLPDDGEDTCLREVDWAEGFSEGILMSDEAWEGQMSRARCDELLAPVRRIAALPLTAPPSPGTLLPALSEEEHALLERELVGAVAAFYLGVGRRRSA